MSFVIHREEDSVLLNSERSFLLQVKGDFVTIMMSYDFSSARR